MTEQRKKYRTGNEEEEIKASALHDLKIAVMQYIEAGGEVKETRFWNAPGVVLVLENLKFDEWRK